MSEKCQNLRCSISGRQVSNRTWEERTQRETQTEKVNYFIKCGYEKYTLWYNLLQFIIQHLVKPAVDKDKFRCMPQSQCYHRSFTSVVTFDHSDFILSVHGWELERDATVHVTFRTPISGLLNMGFWLYMAICFV